MKKKWAIMLLMVSWHSGSYAATWQETLEQTFDIVETFDELQDWKGSTLNGQDYLKENQVKKSDGSP